MSAQIVKHAIWHDQIDSAIFCYQSTLLLARPDEKWDRYKHSSVELVENLHNLHFIHEDSNNTKDNNLGWSKSMVGGTKESIFCRLLLTYTANQAIGKVPKLLSKSASRDTPVTVGRLRNVRSGKQVMLTQSKKKRTSWNQNISTRMARLPVTKLGGISP